MGTKVKQEASAIIHDQEMTDEEKGKRLAKVITGRELKDVIPEVVKLKEPLRPKTENMRTINLSIHKVYFNQILSGRKKIEFRDFTNEYYVRKCTYEENGKRYLVPFDAIVLWVGHGKGALTATVALTDITCSGGWLMFHVGKVLSTNARKHA